MLAKLLRMDMIPAAYIPPREFQELRELTRTRAKLAHAATRAKCELHALLCRANVHPPFRNPFGVRGRRWFRTLGLGIAGNIARDELLLRVDSALNAFYTRIHKQSSKHIARVSVARKLAGICWCRLRC